MCQETWGAHGFERRSPQCFNLADRGWGKKWLQQVFLSSSKASGQNETRKDPGQICMLVMHVMRGRDHSLEVIDLCAASKPTRWERGFHGILRPFPIEAHLAVPFATTTGSAVALCLVSCHRSILRIIEQREEPICQWNMHTEDVEAARSVSLESPGSDYPAAMVSLPQPARSSIQRANVDMPCSNLARLAVFFEAKRGASSTGMAGRAFHSGHLAVYSTCMVCPR